MGAQLQGYGHRVPEQGPASGSRGESSSELDKQGWETASCLGLTALMEEEPSSAGCGAAPRCPGAAGPFLPPPQTQLSARCCCSLPLCPAAGSPWQPLSAGLSEGVITLSAELGPPAPPAARAAPREAGIDSAALDGCRTHPWEPLGISLCCLKERGLFSPHADAAHRRPPTERTATQSLSVEGGSADTGCLRVCRSQASDRGWGLERGRSPAPVLGEEGPHLYAWPVFPKDMGWLKRRSKSSFRFAFSETHIVDHLSPHRVGTASFAVR